MALKVSLTVILVLCLATTLAAGKKKTFVFRNVRLENTLTTGYAEGAAGSYRVMWGPLYTFPTAPGAQPIGEYHGTSFITHKTPDGPLQYITQLFDFTGQGFVTTAGYIKPATATKPLEEIRTVTGGTGKFLGVAGLVERQNVASLFPNSTDGIITITFA